MFPSALGPSWLGYVALLEKVYQLSHAISQTKAAYLPLIRSCSSQPIQLWKAEVLLFLLAEKNRASKHSGMATLRCHSHLAKTTPAKPNVWFQPRLCSKRTQTGEEQIHFTHIIYRR
uniref:Uncharacterized protein n=1 Tax=Sphaerodactylus townsendi TaxID=933632 RepID=A0ACB8FXK3_9SAUR